MKSKGWEHPENLQVDEKYIKRQFSAKACENQSSQISSSESEKLKKNEVELFFEIHYTLQSNPFGFISIRYSDNILN